jgi:hypothetical protein
MPKSKTAQETDPSPAQNRPLDDESLTHLLRTTLFSGPDEEQLAQAEIEPEVETAEEPEEVTEEVETTETESDEPTDEAEEAEEDEPKEEEPKDESPQFSKGVQKRIDKLVAQKKEAEEKLRALTEEVEQSKTMANTSEKEFIPVGDGINPYFKLQTEREVQGEIQHARSIRRWAEENADGAVVKGKDGNEVDYSAEDIRQIKLNAIDALEEHLPKQLGYVTSRKSFDAEAERLYPFWKQRQSTEYQLANTILREFPELQKFPDFRISLGDMVAGRLAREGAAKKRLPVVTKKAPAMPRSTLAPARSDSATAKYSQADQSFRQNPTSLDALQHLVATKFL